MKINEIVIESVEIDEGLMDAFKGAIQGYQDTKTTRQGRQSFEKFVNQVAKGWLTYSSNKGIGQTNPQYKALLDQYIQISAGEKGKPQIPNPSKAAFNTPQGLRQYVNDGLVAYNSAAAGTPPTETPPTGTPPAGTPTAGTPPASTPKFDPNTLAQSINAALDSGDMRWTPALKMAVKNLWMRMGGTKAESKINKAKIIK